jgi:hypothetical protein
MTLNLPPSLLHVFTNLAERGRFRRIGLCARNFSKIFLTFLSSGYMTGMVGRRLPTIFASICTSISPRLCEGCYCCSTRWLQVQRCLRFPCGVPAYTFTTCSGRRPYRGRLAQALRTAFRRTDEALLTICRSEEEAASNDGREESSGAAAAVVVLLVRNRLRTSLHRRCSPFE